MVRFFRKKKEDEQAPGIEQPEPPPASEDSVEAKPEPAVGEEGADVEQAVERTRRTFFSRIGGIFQRGLREEIWEELEETLIAADTGAATAMKVIDGVKERVKAEGVRDPEAALALLKEQLRKTLEVDTGRGRIWHANGQREAPPKPAVILVVGVNGTGKTTSIGKLAHAYRAAGQKVVLAAGDTFRAAAIDQLKHWGQQVGVDVVAHKQGADPGAVVFDAMAAAESRDADVVIIDTAGRLHTKAHLMEELRKVNRIIERKVPDAPHEVLLVLDATSGQNAMHQAKYFTEAVGVTGVVLAKLDGTAKGGVIFSVCDQLGVPVRFVGTGERPQDLARFQPGEFVDALFAG